MAADRRPLLSETDEVSYKSVLIKALRALFYVAIVLAGIAVIIVSQLIFTKAAVVPNILLIVGSSHSIRALGCYNYSIAEINTPNLDRLCSEGIRIDNAFATTGSAAGTFQSLMTGEFSADTNNVSLNEFKRTQHFFKQFADNKKQQYQTSYFGKLPLDREDLRKSVLSGSSSLLDGIGYYSVLEGDYSMGDATPASFKGYLDPTFITDDGLTTSIEKTDTSASDTITSAFKSWLSIINAATNEIPWVSTLYYPGGEEPWFGLPAGTPPTDRSYPIPASFFEQLNRDSTMKSPASELALNQMLDLVASWALKLDMDNTKFEEIYNANNNISGTLGADVRTVEGMFEWDINVTDPANGLPALEKTGIRFDTGYILEGSVATGSIFNGKIVGEPVSKPLWANGTTERLTSVLDYKQAGDIKFVDFVGTLGTEDGFQGRLVDGQFECLVIPAFPSGSVTGWRNNTCTDTKELVAFAKEKDIEVSEARLYCKTECTITNANVQRISPFQTFYDRWLLVVENDDESIRPNERYIDEDNQKCTHEPCVKKGFGSYPYSPCHMDVAEVNNKKQNVSTCDFKPTLQYTNFVDQMDASRKTQWENYYNEVTNRFIDHLKEFRYEHELKHELFQLFMGQYVNAIEELDRQIGEIYAALQQSNVLDSTVVVYTTDGGYMLGEHGMYGTGMMYDSAIKIPIIARYPALIDEGSISKRLVLPADIGTTLLSLADADLEDGLFSKVIGHDLLEHVHKPNSTTNEGHSSFFYRFDQYPGWNERRSSKGVRTAEYKLIEYYDHNEEVEPPFLDMVKDWSDGGYNTKELYHLAMDPDEVHNVYNLKEYAADQETLEALLASDELKFNKDAVFEDGFVQETRSGR